MGFLRLTSIALTMNACYSPDARNWPTPPDDATTVVDGRVVRPDAAPPDAPPDAPRLVELHVQVMGSGTIALEGGGSCTKDCMLPAPYGVVAKLDAIPGAMQKFDKWSSPTCMNQPATCLLVPVNPVTISANFVKAD
jgi:hypothetical protein